MIDTLKVYTHEFSIKDNASLTIQPNTLNYETGITQDNTLFRDGLGRAVKGSKAYINNDQYNLTIKSMPKGGVSLFLQMSLPKAGKGENYYPLTHGETRDTFDWLQKDLLLKGIGLDLGACKVSRIDAFRTVSGMERFSTYAPLFQLLRAKRQLRRDYGSTFTWENTRREICVYDKIAEMENRGMVVNHYPANSIRFEYRLKNAEVCSKETGLITFKEVVNNLDAVKDVYQAALKKHLFCFDFGDIEILAGDELERNMRQYMEKGRNWLQMYYRDFGAYWTTKLAGLETVKAVITNISGGNRMKAWRAIKLSEDMRRNFEMLQSDGHKTLSDLYMELKGAVLDG